MTGLDRCSCEETFRRLDDFVDRELTEAEIAEVKQHIDSCEACARSIAFEESVIRELRRKVSQVAIPADLREKVFLRLESP